MKKAWIGMMVIAWVMSSCGYHEALEEEAALLRGELYGIEHGKVTYNNGITLTFNKYGYNQCIERQPENMVDLYLGKIGYVINLKNKTYTQLSKYEFMTEFAVDVKYYKIAGNYRCTKETIAGIECDYIQWKTPSVTYEVACYERLRLYELGSEWSLFKPVETRYRNNIATSFSDAPVDTTIFNLERYITSYGLSNENEQ